MVQQNILSCGIQELKGLKEQILRLDECKTKNAELEVREDQLEKEIGTKEKTIADEIMMTNKKRVEEIALTFDEQSDKTRSRIKKIKSKKEKLKSTKVSERIEDETASLQETNRQLKIEAKKIFKQNQVPAICNTSIYYALFAPKGLGDLVTILIFILGIVLIIPFVGYQLLSPKNDILYILVYVIIVLVVMGLYILMNNATKASYGDSILKVKGLRWRVKANKRQIKEIKHGIIKDNDESTYGLEDFYSEIGEMDEKLAEIAQEKKKALEVFESSTRMVIAEEIKARYRETLERLKAEYSQVYNESKQYEDQIKEMSLSIANVYEMYMGKEFMNCEKIDGLIQLMEERNVLTISEGMRIFSEG